MTARNTCEFCGCPVTFRRTCCLDPACLAQRDAATKARIEARRLAAQALAAERKAERRAAKGSDGGGCWPDDEALRADNRRAGERALLAAAERVRLGSCALGSGE